MDWDVTTGKVTYGRSWNSILGHEAEATQEEGISRFESLIHPNDRESVMTRLLNFLSGIYATFECKFRMQHKDGRWIWMFARRK